MKISQFLFQSCHNLPIPSHFYGDWGRDLNLIVKDSIRALHIITITAIRSNDHIFIEAKPVQIIFLKSQPIVLTIYQVLSSAFELQLFFVKVYRIYEYYMFGNTWNIAGRKQGPHKPL